MRRVGQARRRDGNEIGVVGALRSIGCLVARVSAPGFPDLVVWHPEHGLRLVEVKTKAGKLTPAQVDLQREWPVFVVRSPAEALALYGVRVR